jgi:hypothetical protein
MTAPMNPDQRKELVRIISEGVCRGLVMYLFILCAVGALIATVVGSLR